MRRKKNENKSMLAGLIALAEPLFTGFPQVEIAIIHIVEIQTAVIQKYRGKRKLNLILKGFPPSDWKTNNVK